MTIDANDEADNRTNLKNKEGRPTKGFGDITGTHPKESGLNQSSLNKSARGDKVNTLNLGGGQDGISFELARGGVPEYPYNRVMETPGGHILQQDDTPGSETTLIKHPSGAGIEITPDGSIIIRTEKNTITSVAGSSCIIIEGDSDIQVNGNMNLSVNGDLNTKVGGDYNLEVEGNKITNVKGSQSNKVLGNDEEVIVGDKSTIVSGQSVGTYLDNKNDIIKGNHKTIVEGGVELYVSNTYNMTANNMTLFSVSGTIGGDSVDFKGSHFFGETFHGNLTGTASVATLARNAVNAGTSAKQGGNEVAMFTPANIITKTVPTIKTKTVSIDKGNHIKEALKAVPNTQDVRCMLRDPIMNNDVFIADAIVRGNLNPAIIQQIPSAIETITNETQQPRIPTEYYDNNVRSGILRIKPAKNRNVNKFIPNPFYDVNKETSPITEKFRLSHNIRLNKFIKGNLRHINDQEQIKQLARQYSLYIDGMQSIMNNRGEFIDHRLVIADGLYKGETTEGSINWLASKGRAVTFELYNDAGMIDHDKTFDLALYFRDFINYDKMYLSYDYFNIDGSATTQIILAMPEIDENYNIVSGRYKNELETLYNNNSQAMELVKVSV